MIISGTRYSPTIWGCQIKINYVRWSSEPFLSTLQQKQSYHHVTQGDMETNISSYFGNGKWNFRKTHLASLILDIKTSFSLRSRCYLFLIRRLASNYPINKMLRNVFKSSTLLSFHISSVVHRGSILVSAPLKCNASIIGHPLGGDPGQIQR